MLNVVFKRLVINVLQIRREMHFCHAGHLFSFGCLLTDEIGWLSKGFSKLFLQLTGNLYESFRR